MSMDLMVRVMKVKVGDPLSKLALLKLADNASDKGECWPSYQHIADQCEISKRTAVNHVAKLCACGFLRKELRKGPNGNTSNIYFITPENGNAAMLAKFKLPKKPRAQGSAPDSLPPSAPGATGVVHQIHQGSAPDSLPPSAPGATGVVHQIHQGSAPDSLPPSAPAAPESVTLLNQSLNQSKEISTSENSGESPDQDKTEKFLSRHPDAAVYTPSGKSWGTQADLDCAAWIFERVKIINPTQRQPNWTEWANDVRLIRQIDGFTHKEICKLFKRANKDSFWRTNILCPSKLREKWDTLTAKFQTGEPQHVQNTGESTATRQIREALDRWEQGDSPAAMGGDGENLRATVDCEEWSCAGRALDGADWEFDQRPDDERLQLPC
ncbi:helix-turn-helix domain-containing protein [Citrobacter sp. ANG330]|uniref:helix-turn-helix domain-containing protein n=1 Tax=Citrobacter sp. ANG330 TaxID=3048142 RepID=UPI0039C14E52